MYTLNCMLLQYLKGSGNIFKTPCINNQFQYLQWVSTQSLSHSRLSYWETWPWLDKFLSSGCIVFKILCSINSDIFEGILMFLHHYHRLNPNIYQKFWNTLYMYSAKLLSLSAKLYKMESFKVVYSKIIMFLK